MCRASIYGGRSSEFVSLHPKSVPQWLSISSISFRPELSLAANAPRVHQIHAPWLPAPATPHQWHDISFHSIPFHSVPCPGARWLTVAPRFRRSTGCPSSRGCSCGSCRGQQHKNNIKLSETTAIKQKHIGTKTGE